MQIQTSFPEVMHVLLPNLSFRQKLYCRFVTTLVCVVCSLCISSILFAADEKVTGRLIVEDVLARPSTPVRLQARLVQEGSLELAGLSGETITFVVQGQRVGSAVTDKDGRAVLEFKTHMRGNQKIVGEVEPSARVKGVSGVGNFASWERRKPILLVDVMTLLKEGADGVGSFPALPLLNTTTLGEPDEAAPRELTKLGEFYYNIIYLWPGDQANVIHIRDWLKASQFPPGITRAVQLDPTSLLAFIEQLKKVGWDHVEAGIGQSKEFADTLVKNRIKTVIFPDPSQKEKFPRRAKIISSWKDVRKHL